MTGKKEAPYLLVRQVNQFDKLNTARQKLPRPSRLTLQYTATEPRPHQNACEKRCRANKAGNRLLQMAKVLPKLNSLLCNAPPQEQLKRVQT